MVAKLYQGRAIRHLVRRLQSAEPPVTHVHPDLVTEPDLGQVEEVAQQHHPDDDLGVNRRPASLGVQRCDLGSDPLQIEHGVDPAQHVPDRDQLLDVKVART